MLTLRLRYSVSSARESYKSCSCSKFEHVSSHHALWSLPSPPSTNATEVGYLHHAFSCRTSLAMPDWPVISVQRAVTSSQEAWGCSCSRPTCPTSPTAKPSARAPNAQYPISMEHLLIVKVKWQYWKEWLEMTEPMAFAERASSKYKALGEVKGLPRFSGSLGSRKLVATQKWTATTEPPGGWTPILKGITCIK